MPPNRLADYTAELDSESIVITSNEKPVAALISLRGMGRESVALSLSPDFAKIIRVARSEARRGNVFSLDEVKRGLVEATASTKSRILAARGRKRRKSRNTSRRGKIRGGTKCPESTPGYGNSRRQN